MSKCLGTGRTGSPSFVHCIRALERRVEQLEKRLSSEKVSPAKAVERGGAAADWRSKANWRRLKVGMTEDDVRSILGEPQKVVVLFATVYWHWNYPGGPSVDFDKENRRVGGWSEP
jgi:hypothetical protein